MAGDTGGGGDEWQAEKGRRCTVDDVDGCPAAGPDGPVRVVDIDHRRRGGAGAGPVALRVSRPRQADGQPHRRRVGGAARHGALAGVAAARLRRPVGARLRRFADSPVVGADRRALPVRRRRQAPPGRSGLGGARDADAVVGAASGASPRVWFRTNGTGATGRPVNRTTSR